MVPRKRMRVLSYSMCTRVCAQTIQHARKGRTLGAQLSELKPIMLALSVQAVVACNATVLRVCTLVLFITHVQVYKTFSKNV